MLDLKVGQIYGFDGLGRLFSPTKAACTVISVGVGGAYSIEYSKEFSNLIKRKTHSGNIEDENELEWILISDSYSLRENLKRLKDAV